MPQAIDEIALVVVAVLPIVLAFFRICIVACGVKKKEIAKKIEK